ncbi:MAG: V-type ATPase subunit [Crenarchaeota archaeon]|nr:V-type ATPase subunit [Thermoproteota archaeon]
MPAELIAPTALVYMYRGMSLDKEKELSLLTAQTPEEMQNALKGTWLEGLPVEQMDYEEMEKYALLKFYEVLKKLRGYVPSYNMKIMVEVLMDCLRGRDVLLILRAALTGKSLKEVDKYIIFKGDPLVETVRLVAGERGLEGLSQALKGFRMAKYVEKAMELYRNYKDPNVFTLVIDIMLLETLFSLIKRVGKSMNVGTSKIEFARLLCPEIDTLSFNIAARAVLNGIKPPIEPPACEKEVVRNILQARPEEIVAILRRTPYGEDLPDDVYEALAKLIVNGRRIQRKRALAAFAGYPFRLSVILALMLLYRLDARDVATILSGKKAGLDPSKIAEELSYEFL